MPSPPPRRKVAVLGSGLAGLTSAYWLSLDGTLDVHVFEKASTLGFHTSSIEIPDPAHGLAKEKEHSSAFGSLARGKRTTGSSALDDSRTPRWTVDVPMRSFQGGLYPRLLSLYRRLGLPLQLMTFTYSFSDISPGPDPSIVAHTLYEGSSGTTIPSLPSSRPRLASLLRVLKFAVCFAYIMLLSCLWRLGMWPADGGPTLEQWTESTGRSIWGSWLGLIWEEFIGEMIVPLFGAITSADDGSVRRMQVGLILHFIYHTIGTSHYRVGTNSSSVSSALVAHLPPSNIHLSTSISSLSRSASSASIKISIVNSSGAVETLEDFGSVVLATQAPKASALVEGLAASFEGSSKKDLIEIADCLRAFKSIHAIVVNHRSSLPLPSQPSDHRDLNFARCPHPPCPSPHKDPSPSPETLDYFPLSSETSYTMATHLIRSPRSRDELPVFQTTNPVMALDPCTILSTSHHERAFPTSESIRLLPRLHPSHPRTLQGRAGIWIVGAYAGEGIPLLEGCVTSSEAVVGALLDGLRDGITR